MRAFHNDPAIKEKYLARVIAHEQADEIIQGKYWENGKGCAVGCTIHGDDHKSYETELGIPQAIAQLEDGLFERMLNIDAKPFLRQFIKAIPVGADLSKVIPQFMIWLLSDEKYGVYQFANDETKLIINEIIELYTRQLNDEIIDQDQWIQLENKAVDAYYDAHADAHADAAAYAAYDAYYAAVRAADNDDVAYAADDVAYAARDVAAATYGDDIDIAKRQADKLLQLLSDAK